MYKNNRLNNNNNYLKYRARYLHLKNQNGGTYSCNPNVDLDATNFAKDLCIQTDNTDTNSQEDCISECSSEWAKKKYMPSIKPMPEFDIYSIAPPESIIEYLGSLSNPILIREKSDLHCESHCMLIAQGEAGISDAKNQFTILSTFGLGPCHCLIIYNYKKKIGFLSHVDPLSELNMLNNIFIYMETTDINDIQIFITGGENNTDLTWNIFRKLALLNLHTRIIGTHLHSKKVYTQVSINLETGIVDSRICSDFMSSESAISFRKREIKKFAGFDKYDMDRKAWYSEIQDESFLNTGYNSRQLRKIMECFLNAVIVQKMTSGPLFFFIKDDPVVIQPDYIQYLINKVHGIDNKINIYIITSNDFNLDIMPIISNYDLIILDNNNNIPISKHYLSNLFDQIYFYSKSLLVLNNNIPNEVLGEILYDGFDKNSIFTVGYGNILKYKKKWVDALSYSTQDLQLLAYYNSEQGAGIILFGKNTETHEDLYAKYIKSYQQYARIKDTEIKFLDSGDLPKTDLNMYKILVLKVFSDLDAELLLKLINKIDMHKLKIIIVCDNIVEFKLLIQQKINTSALTPAEKSNLIENIEKILCLNV